ncbi:MAG: ATP-binding protein [Mycoplasma sp.]
MIDIFKTKSEKKLYTENPKKYWRAQSKTTNPHWLMLSEFIDNSIKSAEDHNFSDLKIKITFNEQKRTFEYEDNAFGIEKSFKEMLSIEENKHGWDGNESSLSKHGYGVKSALAYYGWNWIIETKNNNGKESRIEIDLNDEKTSMTKNETNQNKIKKTRGTYFLVSNVFFNEKDINRFNTFTENADNIYQSIFNRYERYIKIKNNENEYIKLLNLNKKIDAEIELYYYDRNGKDRRINYNILETITDFNPIKLERVEKIQQLLFENKLISDEINNHNLLDEFEKNKEKIVNYIEENQEKICKSNSGKFKPNGIYKKLLDVLKKSDNKYFLGKNLTGKVFDNEGNEIEFSYDVGIMTTDSSYYIKKLDNKQTYKVNTGFNISQDNRYIYHGPNEDGKTKKPEQKIRPKFLYDELKSWGSGSGISFGQRIFGTIYLQNNFFKPQLNKFDFTNGHLLSKIKENLINNDKDTISNWILMSFFLESLKESLKKTKKNLIETGTLKENSNLNTLINFCEIDKEKIEISRNKNELLISIPKQEVLDNRKIMEKVIQESINFIPEKNLPDWLKKIEEIFLRETNE